MKTPPFAFAALFAAVSATSSLEIHAVAPSYIWNALVDSQPVSQAATFSLRGIELSSDDTSVYATWIQNTGLNSGTPYRRVIRYDVNSGNALNTLTLPFAGSGQQAKSIATDDRGYVYIGSGDRSSETPYIQSYDAALNAVSGKVITPASYSDIYQRRVGGLAVQKSGPNYFLYTSRESEAGKFYLQRYDVTTPQTPTLDTSFNAGAGFFNLATLSAFTGAGFPRGMEVGVDGTLYVTSDDPTGTGASSGRIYRIAPDLSTVVSATVRGAFDVSLYGTELYVSRFENGNAAGIDVLDASNLSFVTGLTGTGTFSRTNTDNDNGYSGIDVASDGRIFVADQVYNTDVSFDRLLVATPTPEPTSIALLVTVALGLASRRRRAARLG